MSQHAWGLITGMPTLPTSQRVSETLTWPSESVITFRSTTSELDLFRWVMLAIGIVIGIALSRR